jgi:hypothetical protein
MDNSLVICFAFGASFIFAIDEFLGLFVQEKISNDKNNAM